MQQRCQVARVDLRGSEVRTTDAESPGVVLGLSMAEFDSWRHDVRRAVLADLAEFVDTQCIPQLHRTGIDIAADVLAPFVDGGKCLRSTFMYLGWLCGAPPDAAALRASGGLELLHAFALLQDDVMDDSGLRRGRAAAHLQFESWHRERGLSGSATRFGASLAVLLSDLCLVWAEQMMRESGVPDAALVRAWPHYDAMRIELAVGQFADVANDAGAQPTLDTVLDVARRKSGNYTVRRPLEIGAAMAGCDHLLDVLAGYGSAIGEAFQLRDDLLGVFGSPSVTGKPAGGDLAERKATSVVVVAARMADADTRRQFDDLARTEDLSESDIDRWRSLITATGAPEWVEEKIAERVATANEHLGDDRLDSAVRCALESMAAVCTSRTT